ncbi:hypothetical protein C0995_006375 [Termitomyces sp. Mi166|nr:hypothetical protein C0995_006375 [Termitomyces sp. Mi166\
MPACQQATASGVPLWALSEVEMATSKIVDEEEFEILQPPRTPRHRVTIKEEVHERTAPEGTVTSRLAASLVELKENISEHMLEDTSSPSWKTGRWTCYHLAACCYGGDDISIFVLHEFIDGEVWKWFHRHVLHTNQDKQDWTFKEVLIGLYNRFVNVVTMQEAREAFRTAVDDTRTGIQTFYDKLVGHAQNMAVYLDEFTIQETFLDGIAAEMHCVLVHNNNLSPEVNTVTEFLVYAICYEQSACTATHYDQRSSCRTQGHRQPVKVGTFLAKCSEMEQNCNLQFVVQRRLPAGQRAGSEPTGDAPVAKESRYMLRVGQPGPKGAWDGPPKVSHPKVLKVQVQAAHTAVEKSNVESNAEENQEELIDDKEVPPEVEEPEGDDDTESVHIDGDEYITVDVYDNKYYACNDEEEHLFALTEHQGDKCICIRRVILQKAADKLQQPQYTPQEKECLVTYVEVNGHPAWTLWDSGSTTMGIMPQFAHVNAICVHELSEPLMLQLETVGSHAMVQFGAEVKIKASGHLTKEYMDIANFDHYDMIISTPFMCKNKVTLDFVKNEVIVNGMPLKAERIVLANMDGCLQHH